eukprot:TRINITY_DN18359_c0_g1_i1.p1 TRINITY_DN18359_c0_g1~~TRINITY_DN18359_c0_g1_i1.p1  ORF type:complete len:217 (+),score=52.70 TRINITY_DN18359_c0_g1_i1:74-724(+)
MPLEEWKDIVGNSATITTIIQFLVGSQVCAVFYKNKTTGETSGLTFLVGVVMTFAWYSYGRLIDDPSIQLVNAVGLVLQTLYCFCFYAFTPSKFDTGRRMVLTVLFVVLVQLYIRYEDDIPTAQLRLGLLCSSMAVAYCSAPLASVQHVFSTGSTQSMPFYLILATVAVTGQWTLYGIIIQDSFVLVPNLLGCAVASFQLALFAYFPTDQLTKYVV